MITKRLFNKIQQVFNLSWFPWVALLLITFLAAGLRFYKLGEWSFWIDELFTITRAQGHFNWETLLEQWWRPPLSVILTGGFLKVSGVSEWSARFVSAMIGIISVPVLYFLTKRLFNHTTALLAALLLALSPWHLFWSQNARFYTSLMILYFLAAIGFYYFIETLRVRYLIFFGIFLFLAMSERLIALMLVPVLITYLLSLVLFRFEKPVGFRGKYLLWLLVPVLAIILLEVYSLITTGASRIITTLGDFAGNVIDDPIRIFILIVFNIGLPLLLLGFISGLYFLKHKSRKGLFLFVNAVVPIGIVIMASPFFFVVDRYAFVTLPSFIILAAAGINEVFQLIKPRQAILSLALLGLMVAPLAGEHLMYYRINHGNRPDWRQAFNYVKEKMGPEDKLVSSVARLGEYYTEKEVIGLGEIDTAEMVNGSHKYWFVIDSENAWWTPREFNFVVQNAELLDVVYLRVRENINLRVYYFDPERRR